MIALATSFTIARFAIRASKRRFWLLEDILVGLAWACCTSLCIAYICVTPAVYRIGAVGRGDRPPYATIENDSLYLVKIFFPCTLLLWTTLWLVKFALLLQCRRLVDRVQSQIIIWRCIVGFTALVYVGCVVSEFTSCRSLHDWFAFRTAPLDCKSQSIADLWTEQCSTTRDARAATISLFYSFAVDMVTDLMSTHFALSSCHAIDLTDEQSWFFHSQSSGN